jgi:hypothetical protein
MKKPGQKDKTNGIPLVPLALRGKRRYSFEEIDAWLRSLGATPIDAATKKRLIASGHWGVPDE